MTSSCFSRSDMPATARRSAVIVMLWCAWLSAPVFGQDISFEEKPKVIWRFRAGDKFRHNSPLVRGGVVYCGCQDGKLYAVDAADGKLRWAFRTGADMMSHYPATDEERIFFGSADGYVYALNLQTGKQEWRVRFDRGGTCCNPCIAGDVVVFGGVNVSWTAFDRKTGKAGWVSDVPGRLFAHLASDGKIVCGIAPNTIYAADAATGKMTWSHKLKASRDCTNPVVFVGGRACYLDPSGGNAACIAREPATGEAIWRFASSDFVLNDCAGGIAASDGKLYVVMNDLIALDAASGRVLWKTKVQVKGAFSDPVAWPAAAGGVVLVGATDRVAVFDAGTGARLWDMQTGGMVYSRPAFANGRIYFGCDDAYLYCLGYDKAVARGPSIPVTGPVPIPNRHPTFLMHEGAVYALFSGRNGIGVEQVDLEKKRLVHRFSMPGTQIAWMPRPGFLWGAGAEGPSRQVELATGTVTKIVPNTGRDVRRIKAFSHVGDIAFGRTRTDGTPGELVAMDVTTGEQLWKINLVPNKDVLEVTGGAERVYLIPAEPSGRTPPSITALDARSGKVLWKTDLPLPVDTLTTALEYDGTLYLGCNPPAWRFCPVFVIDAATGDIRWQAKIDGTDSYVLTADPAAVYVTSFSEGRLMALRRTDGKPLWSAGGFTAYLHEALPPTPGDRPLFLLKDNVTVVAVDRATGRILAEAVLPEKIVQLQPLGTCACAFSEKRNLYILQTGDVK